MPIGLREGASEMSMAAADVAQSADARKILGSEACEDFLGLDRRIARHRPVEDGAEGGVRSYVIKQLHAELADKTFLAAVPQYRHKLLPRRVKHRTLFVQGHGFERMRMIFAQERAGFG